MRATTWDPMSILDIRVQHLAMCKVIVFYNFMNLRRLFRMVTTQEINISDHFNVTSPGHLTASVNMGGDPKENECRIEFVCT